MLGSVVLEVAIALGLLYAVLSIASSALTEGLASLLALRARTLRSAIVRMLGGSETRADELLSHPRISGVTAKRPFAGPAADVPDRIEPRAFATALFDILGLFRSPAGEPGRGSAAPDDLAGRIAAIESKSLRRALQSLVLEAGAELGQLREGVEAWFDEAMLRARALYAARARTITLLTGFAVIALINADTIMFSRHLWEAQAVRTVLVTAAEGLDFTAADGGLGPEETVAILQWYPLGWSTNPEDPRALPRTFVAILTKIGGLVLTVLAISLGAPFWFDALNGLITLRRRGQTASATAPPGRSAPPRGAPETIAARSLGPETSPPGSTGGKKARDRAAKT